MFCPGGPTFFVRTPDVDRLLPRWKGRVRVLHLFADWKWTGPSEPVLNLCLALRALGHEVWLATPRAESNGRSLPSEARRLGCPLLEDLEFPRGILPIRPTHRGARLASEWIDRNAIDILHVHTTRDHILGAAARLRSARKPPLVRTNFRSRPLSSDPGGLLLIRTAHGVLEFSDRFRRVDGHATTAVTIPPALRLEQYEGVKPVPRSSLGFSDSDFVVGLVLRVQKHRAVDIAIDALSIAHRQCPRIRALVLGRGTRIEPLAIRPVRERGLDQVIRFAGYLTEGYLPTLAALDMLLFLKPGSDATARALREGMVLGIPPLVSRFGLLPDLVGDGGIVCDLEAASVAAAILRLSAHPEETRRLGQAAARHAKKTFRLEEQAARVAEFYRSFLPNP